MDNSKLKLLINKANETTVSMLKNIDNTSVVKYFTGELSVILNKILLILAEEE